MENTSSELTEMTMESISMKATERALNNSVVTAVNVSTVAGSSSRMKQKFPGKTMHFKPVADKIIGLLEQNLGEFGAYKGWYTASLVSDLRAQLEAAVALPDVKDAIAQRAADRVLLAEASRPVRLTWQMLKGFIESAFPQSLWAQRMNEAGWEYYARIGTDWASNNELCDRAIKFIGVYSTELSQNNNMPGNFKTTFEARADKFKQAWKTFNEANDTKVLVKIAKIEALNTVYATLVSISKDAARLFRAEKRQLFAYTYQLATLRGGSATLKGYATDEATGNPAAGVSVRLSDGKEAVTDENGYFKITRVRVDKAADDPVVVFSKPGLETVALPVAMKPATSKTVRVKMREVMGKGAPEGRERTT